MSLHFLCFLILSPIIIFISDIILYPSQKIVMTTVCHLGRHYYRHCIASFVGYVSTITIYLNDDLISAGPIDNHFIDVLALRKYFRSSIQEFLNTTLTWC